MSTETIEKLRGWGFADVHQGAPGFRRADAPPILRRDRDDRTVVVCADGRLATWQGGGSSRTVDLRTFERDYATPATMPFQRAAADADLAGDMASLRASIEEQTADAEAASLAKLRRAFGTFEPVGETRDELLTEAALLEIGALVTEAMEEDNDEVLARVGKRLGFDDDEERGQ